MSDQRRLSQLASTYFHQDFEYEAPTPDGVVLVFVGDIGPAGTRELLGEVEQLLASELDDRALAALWLDDLRSYYDPRDADTTFRGWFTHLRDLLRASAAEA